MIPQKRIGIAHHSLLPYVTVLLFAISAASCNHESKEAPIHSTTVQGVPGSAADTDVALEKTAARSSTEEHSRGNPIGRRCTAEQKAVSTVRQFGGQIFDEHGGSWKPGGQATGVSLTCNRLTTADLSSLAGLRALRELDLSNSCVSNETARGLESITQLKVLRLSFEFEHLTDAGLIHLRPLVGLESLELGNNAITDAALVHLGGLTALRELGLGGNAGITGVGFRHLGQLSQLRRLNLHRTSVTGIGLGDLVALLALRDLDLSDTAITDDGLRQVGELTRLETLNLADTKISDAGLKHLHNMTALRQLYLVRTSIGNVGLENLTGLRSLRTLGLSQTQVTEAGLSQLINFPDLKDLDLNTRAGTDKGVDSLMPLRKLERLAIWDSNITDVGFQRLGRLPSLNRVELGWKTYVTPKAIEALKRAVPGIVIERFQ